MHRCEYIVPVLDDFMHWTALDESSPAFQVFPNPSKGILYLSVDRDISDETTIQVFDGLGRRIDERIVFLEAGSNILSLDLSLVPGVYFLKIDREVVKIVRQ